MYLPTLSLYNQAPCGTQNKTQSNRSTNDAPNDRTNYTNASNKLRTALNKLRNDNFTQYVSQINSSDHSLWKPLKSRKKPTTTNPPICKSLNPPSPLAQKDKEKAALLPDTVGGLLPE
jgi:hypothetical protein